MHGTSRGGGHLLKVSRLSPVDSILTRMGAYDNMSSNASTFKVELDEWWVLSGSIKILMLIHGQLQDPQGRYAKVIGHSGWYVSCCETRPAKSIFALQSLVGVHLPLYVSMVCSLVIINIVMFSGRNGHCRRTNTLLHYTSTY